MSDMNVKVSVDGNLDGLMKLFSPGQMKSLCENIGFALQEKTADHIAKASKSRHKTADGLGAPHSKFLEFAPGRVSSNGAWKPKDGSPAPSTYSEDADESGVSIVVANSPGMSRAFGPMTIRAKDKPLTIPINKVSYARRCAELRDEGWRIFRPKNTNLLFGTKKVRKKVTGTYNMANGKKGKASYEKDVNETIPLYVLKGQVTIPQDRGLLPLESDYEDWAGDVVDAFIALSSGGN